MLSAYTTKGTTIIPLQSTKHNKLGVSGIYNHSGGRYRIELVYNHVKYAVGIFDDFDYAVKIRNLCEVLKKNNKFEYVMNNKPNKRAANYYQYWNALLDNYKM